MVPIAIGIHISAMQEWRNGKPACRRQAHLIQDQETESSNLSSCTTRPSNPNGRDNGFKHHAVLVRIQGGVQIVFTCEDGAAYRP